jgi:hypothetical protein
VSTKLPQLIRFNAFPPVEIPERMAWTSSSIKLFRKCKRKFFWKYIMRFRPKYRDKNLAIGSAFHNTLGEWYKGKRSDIGAIAERYHGSLINMLAEQTGYYDQDEYDKVESAIEVFSGMMLGYGAKYYEDRKQWNIERNSIEAKFKVDMGEFDYMGKMDLVTNHKKYRRLVEHKSASSIRSSYIDRLPLDTQIRGYVFGATEGLGITGINEVLYDVMKKCKLRRKSNELQEDFNNRIRDDYVSRPDFYFYREVITIPKDSLDAFQYEVRQTHAEYQAITKEMWADKDAAVYYLRTIGDPLDPRSWTPNDAVCDDFFRACEFLPLCTQGLDRATGHAYEQNEAMHEELVEVEAEA